MVTKGVLERVPGGTAPAPCPVPLTDNVAVTVAHADRDLVTVTVLEVLSVAQSVAVGEAVSEALLQADRVPARATVEVLEVQ